MGKGKIIFLNGVSSTGKSTISRALQKALETPYHWLNVDNFISFTDMRQNPMTYFKEGEDPVSIFPHVIKLYSDLGINVIADVAFMKWKGPRLFLAEETMEKCIELLHDYPVMYVHVTCPYHELCRRHKERGNRGKGVLDIDYRAAELVGDIESVYDLTIDTFSETDEENIKKILTLLNNEERTTAFKTLWTPDKQRIKSR